MQIQDAISLILRSMPDYIFICSNGLISRWAWKFGNSGHVFPMLGSMGLAQSIAVGLAHSKPDLRVGVINGDGNVLMEPSSLILAAGTQNKNLVHFCLNNTSYYSTGGQSTLARPGLLSDLAKASGYARSVLISSEEELKSICFSIDCPTFCEVIVQTTSHEEPERVSTRCEGLTEEVMKVIAERS